ncbi:hypothetical protein [Winogradskyella sp. R77965]|uniref:hypothetical protein n=1 Tax=Winogradskyella sp. R77965 TaxID=3093872 RepID=UPI0037DC19F1
MRQDFKNIEDEITKSSAWENTMAFFNKHIDFGDKISISILDILIVITVIALTTVVLRVLLRILTRNLPEADKGKFNVVYGYFRWLIYIVILLITLHSVGVNVTAVFAASAALLIGVGLALQTLFQDIIFWCFYTYRSISSCWRYYRIRW